MKYQSLTVTKRGGPETLRFVEHDLRAPGEFEARIRIIATPICQDDIAVRVGNRPFLKKPPYTPGYTFVGVVEAVGNAVSEVAVGDRVAAITTFGSHAEVIYWDAKALVRVPEALDPAEAVTLILNYLVAYQILHRVAKVKKGDKVLLIGASGGVGTAFLQLGRLAGLQMYALASPNKHALLTQHGAVPIDYHTSDFVNTIRRAEPGGLDYVFNGMGEEYFERGLSVLRRGGALVAYGAPQSFLHFLLLVGKFILYNLLPNGKTIKGYGTHRESIDLFKEDWNQLFRLLEEKKIQPVISRKLSLFEAVEANRLLESGQVTGNLVFVTAETLDAPARNN